MLVYALPWTFTAYVDVDEPQDIRDVQDFERESGQLALSSFSEYLPVSADASQLSAEALSDRFAAGDVIPRLLPSENDTDTV